VCLLKKAIYSLKQAGRQWHVHLHDMLGEFDLQKNVSGDMSIFIKRQDGGDLLIALVYVDDITLFGMLDDINMFKMQIAKCYKISDLGEITQFLGLHVVHNHLKNTLAISQKYYIQCILQHFDMSDCTPAFTLFAARMKLQANADDTLNPKLRAQY